MLALMIGIRVLAKKREKREDEEEGTQQDAASTAEDEEEEEKRKRGRLIPILAIPILAIIGIILFILTQDIRLPMTMVDLWTIAHGVLFLGGIVSYIFAYKNEKDEDEDSDEEHPEPAQA